MLTLLFLLFIRCISITYQSNPIRPPPSLPSILGKPWVFDERLAPYGEEIDVKRSPPGRAFDRDRGKDYVEKAKATRLRKRQPENN